ncbi:MAG: hypothetical protein K0R23_1531 [Lacrimispora sp.]|nr:hypothetical protein [Lacrimispora sp.]
MNKKIILTLITVSCLATGCGKAAPPDPLQGTGNTSASTSQEEPISIQSSKESNSQTAVETERETDYSQFLKKNWIRSTDTNFPENGGLSIAISSIKDGKIKGEISAVSSGPAYNMDSSGFEGTVDGDTAQCELVDDSRGNKGTVRLTFKSPGILEAAVLITERSEDNIMTLPEGTFQFAPNNLKNVEGFEPIGEQSFMVDLDSWGKVKFVSGKLTAGSHIPAVFYLTDEDGNIFYQFDTTFPYSVDVDAVSFKDLNKDGLKDIIIIVSDQYEGSTGLPIANVCFQQEDGTFMTDYELCQQINDSGNNKDIKMVTNYILNKK